MASDFDPVLDRWADDFVVLAQNRGMPSHLESLVRRAARVMLGQFLGAMLRETEAEYAPKGAKV